MVLIRETPRDMISRDSPGYIENSHNFFARMFIDLNVPFSPSGFNASTQQYGKQKNKQKQKAAAGSTSITPAPTLSAADLDALNTRLNTLVRRELFLLSLRMRRYPNYYA